MGAPHNPWRRRWMVGVGNAMQQHSTAVAEGISSSALHKQLLEANHVYNQGTSMHSHERRFLKLHAQPKRNSEASLRSMSLNASCPTPALLVLLPSSRAGTCKLSCHPCRQRCVEAGPSCGAFSPTRTRAAARSCAFGNLRLSREAPAGAATAFRPADTSSSLIDGAARAALPSSVLVTRRLPEVIG
jgi:hypothetical protein